MPRHEDMATAADSAVARAPRPPMSRRSALRTAATTGVAVTALAAASGPALAAVTPARPPRDAHPAGTSHTDTDQADAAASEPIIAHLRDAATGEIDLFRGTSRVRFRDPALAAQLVRASR